MSPAPSLASIIDAIESLDSSTAPTFPELLQKLYDLRYQGEVTLHFAGGVPRSVVLSQPVQLPLEVPSKSRT